MSPLEHLAARAKREGSLTEEWSTVRNLYFGDDLKYLSGTKDMHKIRAWADSQGLLMNFDFEFEGFSGGIRTVTFSPKR